VQERIYFAGRRRRRRGRSSWCVRMLCFAGEIVGESGSAVVGMPASCNSEGLAALALWNCSGVHPSLWVSILSVSLSVFCFLSFL
jgi:hypothetical protein